MIVKHTKCQEPYGVLKYVMEKPGAELIGSNMGYTQDPLMAAKEMTFSCHWADSRLRNKVYHASIAVQRGERLSRCLWFLIGAKYLTKMGYRHVPFLVVRHTDTAHDHIHIVAGRHNMMSNTCVRDSWDHPRAIQVIQDLEDAYGLARSSQPWSTERNHPTVGMIRQERSTGNPAIKPELQDLIDGTCQGAPTLEQWASALEAQGVALAFNPIDEDTTGLVYGYKGLYFRASQLGRAYTLQGLRQYRGVNSPESSIAVMAWWQQHQAQAQVNALSPAPNQVPTQPPAGVSRYRSRQLEL
ncbi:relaxase/mobilization nuclease domain-containing protein [Leptolyngbya sp. PCC 6406]|uniref:relaxase/mobilization nuclease domain-containing protein n=1 Tax=Leptolyngbya sp. PCC 6406 TaxID=1173264 RepID=UPI0002ABE4B6|nr:relaxase/mobilization nuclease domain-containing protein [Leptolyngbya sp. PCC 6406]